VFTRTKHGANRLAQQLVRDGIEADAIHGNKSQSRRTRSLADFKRGAMRVLVATDIAARGLDIEELPHVVNFDLPHVPEDYVHRIGRTGRAGSMGEAVSLVCAEDQGLMAGIERLLKRRVERRVIAGFEAGRPGLHKPEPDDRPSSRQPPRARPGSGSRAATPGRSTVAGSGAGEGRGQQRTSAEPDGNRASTPRTPQDQPGRRSQPKRRTGTTRASGGGRSWSGSATFGNSSRGR
jgi:ATP-dependent RNA helicase RhlE